MQKNLFQINGKSNHFIESVDIALIHLAPENPRLTVNQKHFEKLCQSIEERGFDQTKALKCYKKDNTYFVFAGGTRLRALKHLGHKFAPVFLYEGFSEVDIWRMAYEDNETDEIQNPVGIVDVWLDYQKKNESGMTQQQIADALGVGRTIVAYRIQLAGLPEEVHSRFVTNKILNERHARELVLMSPGDNPHYCDRSGFLCEIIDKVLQVNSKNEISSTVFKKYVQQYNEAIQQYEEDVKDIEPDYLDTFHQILKDETARTGSAVRRIAGRVIHMQSEAKEQAHKDRIAALRKSEKEAEKARMLAQKQAKEKAVFDKLLLGDCRQLPIPSNIKLVLTDPPYGRGFISNRREKSNKREAIHNDGNIDTAISLFSEIMQKVYPNMQDDAHALVWCDWQNEFVFRQALEGIGFTIKGSIIWDKPNRGTGDLNGSFAPKHERIIHAVKGKPKLENRPPDVLRGGDFLDTEHPTPKPIALLTELIEATTYHGDVVFDPFMGTGPTGVAAVGSKRTFYGCELDKKWFDEALTNIHQSIV